MNKADEIFTQIIQWAEGEEPIRATILVGSRAGIEPFDELADFDVAVFATNYQSYLQEDSAAWDYYEQNREQVDREIAQDEAV